MVAFHIVCALMRCDIVVLTRLFLYKRLTLRQKNVSQVQLKTLVRECVKAPKTYIIIIAIIVVIYFALNTKLNEIQGQET
jgi:hypothetical protein